jgi:hypothetical protein
LRHALEGSVQTDRRSRSLRNNAGNRLACLNLARLDIADYLSPDGGGEPNVPVATAVVATPTTELDYVTELARSLLEQTWIEISTEIDGVVPEKSTATAVKKRIANHLWCSLLVALIREIEGINDTVKLLSDKTKEILKKAVGKHFDSGFSKVVADAVVGIVIDKVWAALTQLVEAHFPILGAKSLRALRILAVFACPSVERHHELYEHAMRPLMDEGSELITERIKTRVITLFSAWWGGRGLALAA